MLKFKYGDFIILKPNAKVILSFTNEPLSPRVVSDGELWAVDDYNPDTGMLNINRVMKPYPGAYCGWVHKKYVKKVR